MAAPPGPASSRLEDLPAFRLLLCVLGFALRQGFFNLPRNEFKVGHVVGLDEVQQHRTVASEDVIRFRRILRVRHAGREDPVIRPRTTTPTRRRTTGHETVESSRPPYERAATLPHTFEVT